ncbi:MAG: hypothetical protein DWH80_14675 [Planctomycetota bacterium]|nr:MAG: hypothetical protein DWH80_14675 [Planctomycetota bacterium]
MMKQTPAKQVVPHAIPCWLAWQNGSLRALTVPHSVPLFLRAIPHTLWPSRNRHPSLASSASAPRSLSGLAMLPSRATDTRPQVPLLDSLLSFETPSAKI